MSRVVRRHIVHNGCISIHMNPLPTKAIEEFQQAWSESTGASLCFEEAQAQATAFLSGLAGIFNNDTYANQEQRAPEVHPTLNTNQNKEPRLENEALHKLKQ